MTTRRLKRLAAASLAALLVGTGAAAADEASCTRVRMSDPGWTDITSTNAMLGLVLEALGYQQKVETLSVPITFEALKNGQIDVFLGNWMPAQKRFVEPLTTAGDLVTVRTNLKGIRFTLAVPNYVAAEGVKSFADLAAHKDKFDGKIYGIEPGAPANQNIQKMIDAGDFGLKGWKVVESSEQGMLSQVDKAERSKGWIVFLAWEPHPMNKDYPLTYLAGGDAYFGPNFGAAEVNTVTRKGFAKDCPNLERLLNQVSFTVDMENAVMGEILARGADPKAAAKAELKTHADLVNTWIAGVKTASGGDGAAAVKSALGF
ncbi:choline ABC transporter substrate-binding protein [Segnochrobactrum spirostomi]|uniref:Choline ABC transporter substrate-binding protein n=1 Tax=Segnochrobactrum spirostomi TaxID=2608987 RepID=A0A6A7XZ38_9HYPH|nr:choline ABC transporter substrate-binding protein [Segnochrobactrum spirostomi]MQT11377.1 choline ABC transporter substrate-binding protein [Segnochrobactrum spirostomi]